MKSEKSEKHWYSKIPEVLKQNIQYTKSIPIIFQSEGSVKSELMN